MKHLLNNLSEEEKNSIREQHEGGMKLDTSRFRTLLEGKSGNVKPLVERFDDEELDEMVGVDYMSDDSEELDEYFEFGNEPLNLVQRFFMYNKKNNPELSDIPEDEWDEFIEDMSDETTSKIMADIMRYRNPEFKEFEAKELGFAQHDGSFDDDDSEFDDEEELDLREFDDLDEDETW